MVKITERKTKIDWALFMEDIANEYPDAEKMIIMTHTKQGLFMKHLNRKKLNHC
jgi:hypothetical protein